MSEILLCMIVIALSLVAIVAIVGMTIYQIERLHIISKKEMK